MNCMSELLCIIGRWLLLSVPLSIVATAIIAPDSTIYDGNPVSQIGWVWMNLGFPLGGLVFWIGHFPVLRDKARIHALDLAILVWAIALLLPVWWLCIGFGTLIEWVGRGTTALAHFIDIGFSSTAAWLFSILAVSLGMGFHKLTGIPINFFWPLLYRHHAELAKDAPHAA